MRTTKTIASLAAALLLTVSTAAWSADVVLVNLDPPGVGLNDPTPATPVGGNPGTTIGEQRVNVYNKATELWGAELDSPVPIFVGATFQPLPCAPTGGVLGAAGPTYVFRDFQGAIRPATWYVSAQADALFGAQLVNDIDIISFFNSDIDDDDPNCLTGTSWYYGYDGAEEGDIDFLTVVMHEINHGLGHLELVSESTGARFAGVDDAYMFNMLDVTTGKYWNEMTDAERLASQVNSGNLVWDGEAVNTNAALFLGARPSVKVLNPNGLAGSYEAQPASFGPPLRENGGTTGKMVLVDDGVGVGTDGCEPIQNKISGKIAIIDRGACAFTVKVLNAQAAGAKGVIVANNQPVGPAPMGGSDPNVTIQSVGVTLDLGDELKAAAAKNSVAKLILDGNFLAGTQNGFVRLYAPNPVAPGSSKSHWDTSATPNLLMEPSINSDLFPNTELGGTLDLSPSLLKDIGWPLL